MERKAPLLRGLALVAVASLAFTSCGGDSESGPGEPTPGDVGSEQSTANEPVPTDKTATDPGDEEPAEDLPANACELLEAEFLNQLLDEEAITVPFSDGERFTDVDQDPSAYCLWQNGGSGLGVKLTVEDASTAEVDDHTDRAYNMDEEPTVEPQDGPGTNAVLLTDTAFADDGLGEGDGFPYGYFFVEGDVAAFVSVSGMEATPEGLRALADEIDANLTAGS